MTPTDEGKACPPWCDSKTGLHESDMVNDITHRCNGCRICKPETLVGGGDLRLSREETAMTWLGCVVWPGESMPTYRHSESCKWLPHLEGEDGEYQDGCTRLATRVALALAEARADERRKVVDAVEAITGDGGLTLADWREALSSLRGPR